jgi:toxin ParE1/3/4
MKLICTVFVMADREKAFDYIEADSPWAAASVDDRIEICVEVLGGFPEMGRVGRIDGTRELVISGTP